MQKDAEDKVISLLESAIPKAREFAGGPGPLEFEFEKGNGYVKIEAKGKAAHASVPEEGTNAILRAPLLAGLTRSPSGFFRGDCVCGSDCGDRWGKGSTSSVRTMFPAPHVQLGH